MAPAAGGDIADTPGLALKLPAVLAYHILEKPYTQEQLAVLGDTGANTLLGRVSGKPYILKFPAPVSLTFLNAHVVLLGCPFRSHS